MEMQPDTKLIIYQLLVRLFGNKNTTNKYYGSIEENGVGKFNDITDVALEAIKELGTTHIWYTGVLEHATTTDYTAYGISLDDPDVVKGRAGSPYAVKDYYDVDPDLAVDVRNRRREFTELVDRTHAHGMKVIVDFIANHVARSYHSDVDEAGAADFGAADDPGKAFDPNNDYYYLPGQPLLLPEGAGAGGTEFQNSLKDGRFRENPAKATGNNVFSSHPGLYDWYDTVKLNYGVDYANQAAYFDPIPPVWEKMRRILAYWLRKGVDGFRCDMAEMVPVEFWSWVIPKVRELNPSVIFIAEAYNPAEYERYLKEGKFDFLYDKVGLYDGLKRLIRDEQGASVNVIGEAAKSESTRFPGRMLRFLENHDEERIASAGFAGNPWLALPAMVVSATLSAGPVMLYFGQEVGEPARGCEGFSGEDNRTTIFDYWGVPEHQKWMNYGAFDGGLLSEDQKKLRSFYVKLLNICRDHPVISRGDFCELEIAQELGNKMYAFLRYTSEERILVAANFTRSQTFELYLNIPADIRQSLSAGDGELHLTDLLSGAEIVCNDIGRGLPVTVSAGDAAILRF